MSNEEKGDKSSLISSPSGSLATRSSSLVKRGLELLSSRRFRTIRLPDSIVGLAVLPYIGPTALNLAVLDEIGPYSDCKGCEVEVGEAGEITVPEDKPVILFIRDTDVLDKARLDLSPLSGLSPNDLQALCFNSIDMSDKEDQLAHLARLRPLALYLAVTKLTDSGLAMLTALTSLEYLDLSQTRITDAGLRYIKELSGLKWLNLSRNQITDAGLIYLQELSKLQHLDLYLTKVSDVGIASLKRALPNCWTDPHGLDSQREVRSITGYGVRVVLAPGSVIRKNLDQQRKTILAIIYNPDILAILRILLERAGYKVVCVEDGVAALEMLRSFKPGLILLGSMMPKMGHQEVLQRLKSQPHTAAIPVIMVAPLGRYDIAECFRLGAHYFVVIPFTSHDLLNTISLIE